MLSFIEGMENVHEHNRDDMGCFAGRYSPCVHARKIDTKEFIRVMIAQEVRTGRLTPSRRRRMVRYAAQFHLSAVETSRLIAECRVEALESEDPEEIYHALRLIEPPPKTMPMALKVAIAIVVALVSNLLLSKWQ